MALILALLLGALIGCGGGGGDGAQEDSGTASLMEQARLRCMARKDVDVPLAPPAQA